MKKYLYPNVLLKSIGHPTNAPRAFHVKTMRVFHVKTMWKPPFPRRFNVEYAWFLCRTIPHTKVVIKEWRRTFLTT